MSNAHELYILAEAPNRRPAPNSWSKRRRPHQPKRATRVDTNASGHDAPEYVAVLGEN